MERVTVYWPVTAISTILAAYAFPTTIEAQQVTISVLLETEVTPERLGKQLESYFRREVRAVGNTELIESGSAADYRISLLATEVRNRSNLPIGYSATVGLHRNCLAGSSLEERLPMTITVLQQASDVLRVAAQMELDLFLAYCFNEVSRELWNFGLDVDWLKEVRGLIAEWDTDFFHKQRRR